MSLVPAPSCVCPLQTPRLPPIQWQPFIGDIHDQPHIQRRIIKSFSGSKIAFEETHPSLGLSLRVTWTASRQHGILRQTQLRSERGSPCTLQVLDGIQNILPASVSQQFQNEFSILVDAYKRNELHPNGLATYSLSSVPTDKAEPSESLRATAVWSCDFPAEGHLLTTNQLCRFRIGQPLQPECMRRAASGVRTFAMEHARSCPVKP
jgi:hypothetical protein